MTSINFVALSHEISKAYREGALDANGQKPETHISDGSGIPCRHCLIDVEAGDGYLLLAHRPFPNAQPYAEIGPIFIHAKECQRFNTSSQVPKMISKRTQMIIRGYDVRNRIVEDTGHVIQTKNIQDAATLLLVNDQISYLHVRSASNTCFQCRIERE